MRRTALLRLAATLCAGPLIGAAAAEPQHAIAMHGTPKLAAGFTAFPYVNPDAPKGGRLTLGVTGSFDSLNPMIVRGEPVAGIREFVIEPLMARSLDEPFTLYGLIADSVDVPPDRSQVTFHIDPRARFSDGKPVTPDDVLFSWALLRDKGRPNYGTYYRKVKTAEKIGDDAVRFVFDGGGDREMPLILGLMPVLPKHAVAGDSFDATTLAPPIGSGPYRVARVDPGRTIIYERNPDYWGRDLPVNRGRYNFDVVRFDYYREATTMFESFKIGDIDLRSEEDPARWAEAYDFPQVADGRIVKAEFDIGLPAGMTALVFNTRRPQFADPRVREALTQLFNFEWINKSLFHGLFKRTESFFERSYLSSAGRPADPREREILAPFPDAVRPDILDGTFRQPVSDGTPHNRANAKAAFQLLTAAGYKLVGGELVSAATGAPLTFEILAGSSAQERLVANFVADLAKLGIRATLRIADSAQYQSRLKDYDFDMIQFTWPASLSPGNEQLFRWSSEVGRKPGSFNYAGVANPAVDATIQAMLNAAGAEEFVSAVRALDRVLLSGHYVIPLFHAPKQWVAHWTYLEHPSPTPLSGYNLESWWMGKRP